MGSISRKKFKCQRPEWEFTAKACLGSCRLTVEEGESLIQRRESDVKTVPLSTLEPLCGWTKEELSDLSKHIRNPSVYECMPNLDAWVS